MNYYFPKNCSTHIRNKSHFINSTNNPVGYRFQPLKVNYNINNHLKNVTNINSKTKKKKHNDSDSNSNSSSSSSSETVVNISFSLKDKIFSPGDKEDPNMSIYNKSQSNYHKRNYSSGNFQSQKSFDEYYSNNNTISSNNINDDVNDIYNNNNNTLSHLQYVSKFKTIVLDLDETLVHSSFKPFHIQPDIQLKIKFRNVNHNVYVLKRPFVDKFLYIMSKYYNIVLFTASIPEYANPLLDKLDKYHVIQKRLFRKNCTYKDGLFIKDLRQIGVDLKDVLLVDNNPVSYLFNKENGIPIKTWHSDKRDSELNKMISFLVFLSGVNDVREIINEVVDKDDINYNKVTHIMNRSIDKLKVNYNNYYEDNIITNCNVRSKSVSQYINSNNNNAKQDDVYQRQNKISISISRNNNCKGNNDDKISLSNNNNYNEVIGKRHNRLKEEIINDINNTNPKINGVILQHRYYHQRNKTHNFDNDENKSINYNQYLSDNNCLTKMYSYNEHHNNNNHNNNSTSHNNINSNNYQREIHPYYKKQNTIFSTSNNTLYNQHTIPYSASIKHHHHRRFIRNAPLKTPAPLSIDNTYPKHYQRNTPDNNNNENKNNMYIQHTNNTNKSVFSKETNYYLKRKMMYRQQSHNHIKINKNDVNTMDKSKGGTFYTINVNQNKLK